MRVFIPYSANQFGSLKTHALYVLRQKRFDTPHYLEYVQQNYIASYMDLSPRCRSFLLTDIRVTIRKTMRKLARICRAKCRSYRANLETAAYQHQDGTLAKCSDIRQQK